MFVVSAKPSQWSGRGKVCHLNLILSSLGESFSWNPTPTCVNHHPCAGKYLDLPWAYRIWTPPPFSKQQKFQIVYFSSCTQRPVHISGSEMWNSICKSHRCLVWSVCVCVCAHRVGAVADWTRCPLEAPQQMSGSWVGFDCYRPGTLASTATAFHNISMAPWLFFLLSHMRICALCIFFLMY